MWRDILFTSIIENQYRKVLIIFPYEENSYVYSIHVCIHVDYGERLWNQNDVHLDSLIDAKN